MNKKTLLLAILIPALFLPAAAEKKPLGFDDFIQIKRVSDLQICPRGDRIALTVTEMIPETNGSNSDIWIIPLPSGKPWKLTSSPAADSNPRWSPDGKQIAFTSTRSGSPQIWTISLDGGEARQLTSVATGASGVLWSPAGDRLLFLSEVYPDCPDMDCNRKKSEEA